MNENMFERIEDYINGSMSEKEQQLFKKEITINEELASALNAYKAIEEEMHKMEELSDAAGALKSTVHKTNSRYFKSEDTEQNIDSNEPSKHGPSSSSGSAAEGVRRPTRIRQLTQLR